MKTKLSNLKRKAVHAILMANLVAPNIVMRVYATNKLKNTKLATGTKKLFEDGLGVILFVEAAVCGICIGKELIKAQDAPQEERPKYYKNVKAIIGIGIVVMTLSTLIPVIFSYYV